MSVNPSFYNLENISGTTERRSVSALTYVCLVLAFVKPDDVAGAAALDDRLRVESEQDVVPPSCTADIIRAAEIIEQCAAFERSLASTGTTPSSGCSGV
jgi:hypothetical protein